MDRITYTYAKIECCAACTEREIGCHSVCKKYNHERRIANAKNRIIKVQMTNDREQKEYSYAVHKRLKK